MKNPIILFSAFAIFMVLLYSCGGAGKNIEEVSLYPVGSGDEFQYIDDEGKIIINPQFSEATIFREGLALVKTSGDGGLFGYISENGEYAIMPEYTQATVFSEGLAWVVTEVGPPSAINKKGEIKFTLQNAEKAGNYNEGLAAFCMYEGGNLKWGFVDKEGNITIQPQFEETRNFSDGLCGVKNEDGKWGYINRKGELIINYQFDDARDMINGYAIVFTGNKAGVVNQEGKYAINPQFQDMRVDGGNFQFRSNNRWGWCSSNGNTIINPQFGNAYPFHDSKMAAVKSGKDWGYADKDGKLVVNPQFDEALPFNGDVAIVISGRNYGLIDKGGKYVVNPQYNNISADLLLYVLGMGSPYDKVETEFLNIGAIAGAVNVTQPEGLALNSSVQDVIDRFEVTEKAFNRYSSEHVLLDNFKITGDARLRFSVIASPFESPQDGWSSKKIFEPSSPVKGFIYHIDLSGRAYDKGDEVLGAIASSMSALTPSPDNPTENVKKFENATHEIKLYQRYSTIVVSVMTKKSEL